MKKLMHISLIALACTLIGTVDAKVMQKRTTRSSMNMQSSARQISEATDALKDAIKDIQSAPADEKAMARQEANDAVANVLATLHERTWSGDLRGYSEEQIKAAGEKLELLYAEEKNLDNQIKAQQLKIDEMKDKSFWGLRSSVKKEKIEEHKEALTELKNLQNKHTKVTSAIRSEEVVAGKAYALSIKRAVYMIGAAAAVGTIYAIDAYGFDSRGKAYLSEQFGKAYAQLPNVPYFGAEARQARALEALQIEGQNAILQSLKAEEAAEKTKIAFEKITEAYLKSYKEYYKTPHKNLKEFRQSEEKFRTLYNQFSDLREKMKAEGISEHEIMEIFYRVNQKYLR